jgi:redox-sensitive bicupin YhaK (pirin superfamily)
MAANPDRIRSDAASREVTRIVASHFTPVTPTLLVRRALPDAGLRNVGPWIFLDHFGPMQVGKGDRGTPPHPHAGIETVTYLLEGGMHHRDSLGHEGAVGAHGAQWMTAGRGIVHAERPAAGALHGLQMWAKLPRAIQLTEPAYRNLGAEELPVFRSSDAQVRVIGGELMGHSSPAPARWPLLLAHVSFTSRGRVRLEVPAGFDLAAYVVLGQARFGEVEADAGKLVKFAQDGAHLEIANDLEEHADVILLGGAPLEEPMVFRGPFVMDSATALLAAEQAHQSGRMGKLAE